MKAWITFLSLVLTILTSHAQGTVDVSQSNVNGNAPASAFGLPFGQSFVPNSLQPIIGVALGVVDNVGVGDVQIALYHADASGSSVVGSPIANGVITAAQISSYYTPAATPLWFPVYFDQAYAQSPGEHLAFTVTGGGTLNFYYANGNSYSGGRILTDGTKDLAFATLVPEPGVGVLGLSGAIGLFLLRSGKMRKCV